jgi:hypothetical protein
MFAQAMRRTIPVVAKRRTSGVRASPWTELCPLAPSSTVSVQRAPRLLDRHAGLEPAEDVRPVAAPVLEAVEARLHLAAHRDRDEDLGVGAERGAREAARRDADDGHRVAVDRDDLADHRRVRAEPRLPVGVAEHGDEVRADGLVVGGGDQAAEVRLETESREVRARDHHPLAVERLPLEGEVRAERAVRDQPGEHGLLPLEVAVHRIAEDQVAVARLVARLRARLRSGRAEVDEPLRLGHGEGAEKHLVEEREDRRVRADAERQGEHGDGGDEGGLEQRTQRELQVPHEFLHGSVPVGQRKRADGLPERPLRLDAYAGGGAVVSPCVSSRTARHRPATRPWPTAEPASPRPTRPRRTSRS